MRLIIEIDKDDYERFKKDYKRDYVSSMIDTGVIANGTPIPDKATNGDVIKAMFPSIEVIDSEVMKKVYTGIPYGELIGASIDCMREWWNAPYQEEKESEEAV